ncbi:MAG: M20 family metallopeptidase [Streptosporangiales bacterium]
MTAAEQAVLDLITAGEIRDLAVDLVRAGGENPPGGEGAAAKAFGAACAARGLDVRTSDVEPDRPNVAATLPGGAGPGLLLLGHTDVVPVGEGWSVPPFDGVVRDGRLYGRGSADMRGGLAAAVVAMSALRRAGVDLAGPVELAALVDEEDTGKGIRAYLAEAAGNAFCVVTEPTELRTVVAARGDSYLEITVTGQAAHSGNPADGRNAIYGATRVVAEIERWHQELATRAHPLAGAPTWSVGQITGGTGTSTVPAECVISADRRLLPGETGRAVRDAVDRGIDALGLGERGLSYTVEMTMEMPGFETATDQPLVQAAGGAVHDAGGPDEPVSGWTAACDGGFVARDTGVPVVVLGAGSATTQAHRPDESVALDDLVVAARTYALCALRLLG